MNILLWVLQVLLAFHTLIGAAWKFMSSDVDLGSLAVIPHEMWLGLAVFEILCAILILSPAYRPKFSKMVPWGALGIAIEMVLFCSIDAMSGDPKYSSIIYWGVTAVIALTVAFGRRNLPTT